MGISLPLVINLVSVSVFDKAGLTITFEGGRAFIQKKDGTTVLSVRCERGMYVVNEATDDVPQIGCPDTPLAMASVSQPTTLEQWHRRLCKGDCRWGAEASRKYEICGSRN